MITLIVTATKADLIVNYLGRNAARMSGMNNHPPRTSDRFINIEGSINLRDFGGYPTRDGKIVKRGLLFRCGALSGIPQSAYSAFAELKIGVICDLRSQTEADEMPTPERSPFDSRVHIPIWPGSSAQFQESLQNKRPEPKEFIEFMQNVTRDIARDHVEAYRTLVAELIDTDRGFLLHCSAGKDRTGFGAAIILKILNVADELIFEDYLISNQASELGENMKKKMLEQASARGEDIQPDDYIIGVLSGVRKEYLEAAFLEIDEHFDGISGYMDAIGVNETAQSQLRQRLLS